MKSINPIAAPIADPMRHMTKSGLSAREVARIGQSYLIVRMNFPSKSYYIYTVRGNYVVRCRSIMHLRRLPHLVTISLLDLLDLLVANGAGRGSILDLVY